MSDAPHGPLDILHVQKVGGISGSESHLLDLLPRLEPLGFRPSMAVLADRRDRPEEFIREMRDRGIATFEISLACDGDPFAAYTLARLVRGHRFRLVHTHLIHADVLGSAASLTFGATPLVSTQHGYDLWRLLRRFAWLDRAAAIRQRRIIVISEGLAHWLCEAEGLPREKMRIIHYGLDGHTYREQAPSDSLVTKSGHPRVGVVARMLEQKGIGTLLEAFAHVVSRIPHVSLVLVGEGPDRRSFQDRAQVLEISSRCNFLGRLTQAEVSSVLRDLDLFVFPSFGEGFGLVLLEAMAWGLPVVASDVLAIPEIVAEGRTGLLVPPGNAEELAEAMIHLLERPSIAAQMGEEGRRRLEQRFAPQRAASETARLYRELL